jgi:flavin reductase (DIM6/NTAB) family NADH-FMN oxidoreductase RutF
VDAPYVEECAIVLECELIQTHEIGLHTLFIGEIIDVRVDEGAFDKEGVGLMSEIKPLIYVHDVPQFLPHRAKRSQIGLISPRGISGRS